MPVISSAETASLSNFNYQMFGWLLLSYVCNICSWNSFVK